MEIIENRNVIEEDEPKQLVTINNPSPLTPWVTNPYLLAATSYNTRKAYRHDIRHYENWGGHLPATPASIVHYLETQAPTLNARTLARPLVALRHWHTYQGFSDPTIHPTVQKTMVGITRTHGKPKDKARAITPEELTTIATHLEHDGTLAALRDNAILQVGFFGALRRSELVAIQYEHISWSKDGIDILLPSSKTDQTHEGQYCAIPMGGKRLCAIRALKVWLEQASIQSGVIFRRISLGGQFGHAALTPLSVNQILKRRAEQAGFTAVNSLSSHSLRRGLATSAARAGAPLHAIMRAGRWKQTNTVMEYIEEADRFTDNAASQVIKNLE